MTASACDAAISEYIAKRHGVNLYKAGQFTFFLKSDVIWLLSYSIPPQYSYHPNCTILLYVALYRANIIYYSCRLALRTYLLALDSEPGSQRKKEGEKKPHSS